MANASIMRGDVYVDGQLSAKSQSLPAACVGNTQVKSPAGDAGIAATKLEHQFCPVYSQNANSASAADRRIVHVANGDGEVVSFGAGTKTLCTSDAAITVNLLKNGTTVLSSSITLDSANTAYTLEEATVSSTAYVAGDVFEVNVAVSAGGGSPGNGVFAAPVFREAAQ